MKKRTLGNVLAVLAVLCFLVAIIGMAISGSHRWVEPLEELGWIFFVGCLLVLYLASAPETTLNLQWAKAAWAFGALSIALLLAAGGTWRRIVTDTLTCIPLDIGHHRYRPPAHIAEAVRLRDHTCTRPTCSVPARVCQLDHAEEWQHGGGTSRDELGCLCGRCHREKSIGAGRPGRRKKDGTRDWHSATGRIYPNHPERPPRLHGGPLRGGSLNLAPDPEDLPPDPGPPPF